MKRESSESLPAMLRDLGGPAGPSWPWRTKSAKTVWLATEAFYEKNPDVTPSAAIRSGFMTSGIPGGELTPEDHDILGLAARWKYTVLPHKKQTPSERAGGLLLRMQTMTATQMLKASQKTGEV